MFPCNWPIWYNTNNEWFECIWTFERNGSTHLARHIWIPIQPPFRLRSNHFPQNFTQLRIGFHSTNYTSKHWAGQFLIILNMEDKRCPCWTPNNQSSNSERQSRLLNRSSKEPSQAKWIINLRFRELSKRRVIRVVWSWSWCFRESLNYRLTRRRRWSWKLCSKTSSRQVCKGSPHQGKSGSTIQSGRHFRRKMEKCLIRCYSTNTHFVTLVTS